MYRLSGLRRPWYRWEPAFKAVLPAKPGCCGVGYIDDYGGQMNRYLRCLNCAFAAGRGRHLDEWILI